MGTDKIFYINRKIVWGGQFSVYGDWEIFNDIEDDIIDILF